MTFLHQKIDIRLAPEIGGNCILFHFKDKFTIDASVRATQYWSGLLESQPNESFSFVWDCTDMSGFEPSARKEWYRAMKLYKDQISEIIVISPSILIRGAARVMMEFFGIKSKILQSKDALMALQSS